MSAPKNSKRIAVHLHLHYVDLLPTLIPYLGNIPVPFNLFVTITDGSQQASVLSTCKKALPQATTTVVEVPNKGRDVKPFYTDLRTHLLEFDYVCHIHGKKSLFNNGATNGWLEHLLSNLLGSVQNVTDILSKLDEGQTGLIYPPRFPGLPYWAHNWLSNAGRAQWLQARLGIERLPKTYFAYPIGNMFWAKVDAIKPLFDLNLTDTDYPPENKQTDGEIMHALERMISVVVAHCGYQGLVVDTSKGSTQFSIADDAIDYSFYDTNSLDNLKKAIDLPRIKVVSFDIFDTLVSRPLLEPDDMFDLMAYEVQKRTGKKIAFKEVRRKADASVRERLETGKDVDLDAIYTEVAKALQLTASEAETLKQLELDFEKRMLTKREAVAVVLEYAFASGKRVILTSDMYLNETYLRTLLQNLGITSYHKLYVSADAGYRKDSRTLFPHVLATEKITATELLHIGDNEHSDLQIPGDLGITVFHIKRAKDLFLRSHLGKHVYKHRLHNIPLYYKGCLGLAINKFYDNPFPKHSSLSHSDLELFGYYYFGPLLLSYIKWVADTAQKKGIKKLYFLSRDGEILYKIYKILQQSSPVKLPKAVYIEISRRSLAIPFIKTYQDIDKALQANYFGDTLQQYFHTRLGLNISSITPEELQEYGLQSVQQPIYIPADIEKVKQLAYDIFRKKKKAFAKEEADVIAYLKSKGLFGKATKAIVDIGYSGTMQRQLNSIIQKPIHGLYMVTYNTIRQQIDNPEIITRGLFGNQISPYAETPSINKYSLFYEMILSSVNGPVEKYKRKKDKVRPVYEPVAPEESGKLEKMPRIHKGILNFCRDFDQRFNGFDLVDYVDTEILQEPFRHFIEHPHKDDILMLAGYTLDDHYCGNGVFYWVPTLYDLNHKTFDPKKWLWRNAIEQFFPEERQAIHAIPTALTAAAVHDTHTTSDGHFDTPRDKEIFDWYNSEYEVLPTWYKKIGHLVKLAQGNKRVRFVVEDKQSNTGPFATKAEEIQAWYNKEYEVTPGWFKKVGHVIKIISGKRKLKNNG